MKVQVDSQRCQGHTLCALNAPQAFELSDVDGHATPAFDEIPTEQVDQVFEAMRSCPERAISLY